MRITHALGKRIKFILGYEKKEWIEIKKDKSISIAQGRALNVVSPKYAVVVSTAEF